jgi:hypothetical protein
MAYGKQSQRTPSPGSLTIQWSLEIGHLQPRWATTRQLKPLRAGWPWLAENANAAKLAAVYAQGRKRAGKLWMGLAGKPYWFMRLFSWATSVLEFPSSFQAIKTQMR